MNSCATDLGVFESVGGVEVETTFLSVFALLLLVVASVAVFVFILTLSRSLELSNDIIMMNLVSLLIFFNFKVVKTLKILKVVDNYSLKYCLDSLNLNYGINKVSMSLHQQM